MFTVSESGGRRWLGAAVFALVLVVTLTAMASARVWTDQEDYSPGSVVTISGDNSDGSRYLPGETVVVLVSGPNEYAASCEAVADEAGAWSCQVTLWADERAVGEYIYMSSGQSSGVVESDRFTDSAGYMHTCYLKPDESVDCWGYNYYGQANDQSGPFTQVSAGIYHTCGLEPDGSVDCWGRNLEGQANDQLGPFIQVSAGYYHTCGLKPDGSVDCWGDNYYGQAMDQPGSFSQVSAGLFHTCGLESEGSVDCWGRNLEGQANDQPGSFTQVSAGYMHTCGLKPEGSVDCWGHNYYGQSSDQAGPFTQVSAGGFYTCGLKSDQNVACWGNNSVGQAPAFVQGPFVAYLPSDTTPPILTLPANITAEATGPTGAIVTFTATAQDDVDGSVLVSCLPESGSAFPLGQTVVTCTATDAAGNSANGSFIITVVDTTPPVLTLPADITVESMGPSGAILTFAASALDLVDGGVPVTCSPPSGSFFPPNETVVSCTAADAAGNTASGTFKVKVVFAFTGFLPPVDNPPVLNVVKAGSGVPVKFSLGGDQGLNIFALGYPKSVKITCDTGAPVDGIEETLTAGNSSLQYNPLVDQYTYVWKTDKAWAGTCRQFQLLLVDGTMHTANFKFK